MTAQAWHSAAASQPGPGRSESEDSHIEAPEAGLWAVADGMGGHSEAGLASTLLVETLRAALLPQAALGERMAAAEAAIAQADTLLAAMAETTRPPGSTVSVLLLGEGHAACLWVGDSRIYLRRDGALLQLTRDHSLAQEMVDRGLLESADLAEPAQRSSLTRAVGGGGRLAIDRLVLPVQPGDRLLLCTDGLSMVVPQMRILAALEGAPGPAAQALIHLAAALGSVDDVTALVVAIDAAG
jgi:serine/threonine protein phosphatase PrpC